MSTGHGCSVGGAGYGIPSKEGCKVYPSGNILGFVPHSFFCREKIGCHLNSMFKLFNLFLLVS